MHISLVLYKWKDFGQNKHKYNNRFCVPLQFIEKQLKTNHF